MTALDFFVIISENSMGVSSLGATVCSVFSIRSLSGCELYLSILRSAFKSLKM